MKGFSKGINATVLFLYIFTILVLLLCSIVLSIGGEGAAAFWALWGATGVFFFGLGYLVGKKIAEQ